MKSRESFEDVYPVLWEARYSAKNVIPAKAVEECPDGKDLRPPCTEEILLVGQVVKWGLDILSKKNKLPSARLEFFIPFASREKIGAQSPYGCTEYRREKLCSKNTNRLGFSRIPSRAV